LLNEAEHLTELDCVISTIRKLRQKQFLTIVREFEQANTDDDYLVDCVDIDTNENIENIKLDENLATKSLDACITDIMAGK
jgi:hypothetical protein